MTFGYTEEEQWTKSYSVSAKRPAITVAVLSESKAEYAKATA